MHFMLSAFCINTALALHQLVIYVLDEKAILDMASLSSSFLSVTSQKLATSCNVIIHIIVENGTCANMLSMFSSQETVEKFRTICFKTSSCQKR